MNRLLSKTVSVLLCLLLFGSFFGCANTPGTEAGNEGTASTKEERTEEEATEDPALGIPAKVLSVGYGRACISPTKEQMDAGIEMKGGPCEGFFDDIYAIALAFSDEEGNLFVHIVVDLTSGGCADEDKVATSKGVCDMARQAVAFELGINANQVTLSATHNHSQVEYASNKAPNKDWRETVLIPGLVDAVRQATNDLSPVKMSIGRTETKNLTFVRRYFLNDGSFYDGYTSLHDGDVARHESDADEEIQMVRFTREGKQDILIVNWQSHATKVSSRGTYVTSDYVGPLRDRIEEELGVLPVYWQGTCGNLAPSSRLIGEAVIPDGGWNSAVKLGKAVAAYVIDAVESDSFTEVETGLVKTERIVVTGTVKKYAAVGEPLYNDALKVQEFAKTAANNYEIADYAKQFGIETIYHANTIVQNAKLSTYKTYELNLISIGDVAIATFPMEFFDTSGMAVKTASPFKMTLTVCYACSKGQYCAPLTAIEHGGYETYKAYFADGTAEEAVEYQLSALRRLYPVRKGEAK